VRAKPIDLLAAVPSTGARVERPAQEPRCIDHIGPEEIFAPLEPIQWLCEGLRLAGGHGVTCFAGYGYSGKTILAQSIALSVATGREVFGQFFCQPGRVLHVDYEQGSRPTRERYQRLARGMSVEKAQVEQRLRYAPFPAVYLDSQDAAEVFAAAIDGFDLVIVDALRGAAPTMDENSSDIRRTIDLLARESERTGALPIIITHSRKPGSEEQPRDTRFAIRGSSAIFDACSNVFMMSAKKGEPTQVKHEKDRLYGTPLEDFWFRIEDVPEGRVAGDPRWGLRICHLNAAQIEVESARPAKAARARCEKRITDYLSERGGTFRGTRSELRACMGMSQSALWDALGSLEAGGRVLVTGRTRTEGALIRLREGPKP
jgi:hypothetical protein